MAPRFFPPDDAVARSDHFDLQPGSGLQDARDLRTVRIDDVRIVDLRLFHQDIQRQFIIKPLARRNMLSETVHREKQLLLADVREHRIGPVNHRCVDERQRILAERDRLTVRDDAEFPAARIRVPAEDLAALRRADDFRVRQHRNHLRHGTRMVLLRMIADQVVDFVQIRQLLNVFQERICRSFLYRVDQSGFLVADQIRIIRRAALRIVAVEVANIPVYETDPVNSREKLSVH